jgi:hypothetical protein
MTRITAMAAVALASTLAAGAASAQQDAMGPMDVSHGLDFAAIDTDGNGSLGRAELQARAVERLARGDANNDGGLDREEIIAMLPARRGSVIFDLFSPDPAADMADRILALMGATEAGRVELAALGDRRVNALLALADTDRDAAVSQAEADAMAARREARFERHHRWMEDRGPDSDDRDEPRD